MTILLLVLRCAKVTTMAEYSDPIARSLERNFVKAGSPLERTVRSQAYKFFSSDGSALDERIDNFISESREDAFFADSFTTPPAGAAATMSKATVVPNEQERAAIATSGKVSGVPTSTKAKPKDWQQTDIVQLPPEDFESIRTGKKSFVG